MTPMETLALTRYVKACCPQQAIDKYTPDAWHELLGDLALADCRAAATAVGRRQPFIAPSEIRAEVRKIRGERIAGSVIAAPPAELTGDPRAYCRVLAANVKAAADGRGQPAGRQALPAGRPAGLRAGRPASLREAIAGFRTQPPPAREAS